MVRTWSEMGLAAVCCGGEVFFLSPWPAVTDILGEKDQGIRQRINQDIFRHVIGTMTLRLYRSQMGTMWPFRWQLGRWSANFDWVDVCREGSPVKTRGVPFVQP